MPKVDQFAQIANNGANTYKDELQGIKPKTFKVKYFKDSDVFFKPIKEKSYKEKLTEFKGKLNDLKQNYKAFLRDLSPQANITRRRWNLEKFNFRMENEQDKQSFDKTQNGEGNWEQVTLPDFRGPEGRWTGFYRKEFVFNSDKKTGKRYFIRFLGADYIANVYLNGRFVGGHEGFFAPFEFDVTDYLHYKENNTLVVEIKNDVSILGLVRQDKGDRLDGNKIYAATGLGWDDSVTGWHHCPAGAGLYNKVFIEERSEIFVDSIFVRPDIDKASAEIWTDIYSTICDNTKFDLKISVYPQNFKGEAILDIPCKVEPAGPDINNYRFNISMKDFKLWSPNTPYLYKVRVSVYMDNQLVDQADTQFGMRKFDIDETGDKDKNNLKGSLFLNNEPIILRGANTMGHMQQCVFRGDHDQLIEDILIAKLANMNFYRLTQRPVQDEIYEYCDKLGMMTQTDLPFFGWIRRCQFCEGVKQAREMEHLIRRHPCSIMVTYMNEPFPNDFSSRAHRSLFRNEMEDFFETATKAVRLENPDRVVKNVEGDYDPPTRNGLSDFHCYNMWYTNHALPIGKMNKGFIPPIKKGWKSGCGEYGTEGLDSLDIMLKYYPKEWMPTNIDDEWSPEKIVKAQTYTMHGDWYEEQHNIKDWIKQSQEHQAFATRIMNDAFRLRSDVINSTAVHLLIDAWPAGWMKTLMDCNRTPKPAFFEFEETMEPVRVHIRTDRFKYYSGETADFECYLFNDIPKSIKNHKVIVQVIVKNKVYKSFELEVQGDAVSSKYIGTVRFSIPTVSNRQEIFLDARLIDNQGKVVNQERSIIESFRNFDTSKNCNKISESNSNQNFDKIKVKLNTPENDVRPENIFINSMNEFKDNKQKILHWLNEGTKVIFSLEDMGIDTLDLGDDVINVNGIGAIGADGKAGKGITFVARNPQHSYCQMFKPKDFCFMYNSNEDRIDFLTDKYIQGNDIEPVLFTYESVNFGVQKKGQKRKLPIVGIKKVGKGRVILSTLKLNGMIGYNPILDNFIRNLL